MRRAYHHSICSEIIELRRDGAASYPNLADKSSKSSRAIAVRLLKNLGCTPDYGTTAGQTAGGRFEEITRHFIEQSFKLLQHLRPGRWRYSTQTPISDFAQYEHLAKLKKVVEQNPELSSSLGSDYIIKPDIVVSRLPVSDSEINENQIVIGTEDIISQRTPLREVNHPEPCPLLHASISCKWTLRSDRSQNARAEALNLVRNRKGHQPHIVAVTAEPMPTRIASLALGTGDLDCVYRFALPELTAAVLDVDNEDQLDMLNTLVQGQRLRDISDLPFDLAV